jgi:hypothetical protein
MFGNRRKNLNRQFIRSRVIARDEIGFGFHQHRKKSVIAGQPIELGDYKCGSRPLSVR